MPEIEVHADNAIVWQDDRLYLLDQRFLPQQTDFLALDSAEEVADAIHERGLFVGQSHAFDIRHGELLLDALRAAF